MATQGLVSVVEGGAVRFKIVAGCNGMRAVELAARLRAERFANAGSVYDLAEECGFGCDDCRVVMGASEEFYLFDDDLGELYRKTFDDPRFNPRWRHGTAAHVEVVERLPAGRE